MKNSNSLNRILGILAVACLLGAACGYILGMVVGSNAVFFCGILCAVGGIILGKKTGKDYVFVLCLLLVIATGLELFMRLRDGYTGKGWYYLRLLQHPEENAWN